MTPETPTLSLCMIVRNEEAYLARCLESVRGLVDDIVIVDTGSTDGTLDIARSFGARLFHSAWQDDFSQARNVALERATGDWILSLDADESVAVRDHAAIRAELRLDAVDAIIVPNRSYLVSGKTIGWQAGSGDYDEGLPYAGFKEWDCLRLFRNRPWLRFRNRVHELLVSTDPARPLAPFRGNWVIHHFGKAGHPDVLRAKAEAYLRMGVKKVEEHPRDPQAHYELGVQYAERRQHGLALSSFERALALAPRFRDAEFLIAHCLVHLEQHETALSALGRAARTLPQLAPEIAFEQGNVHLVLGHESEAEHAYRRALASNPSYAIAATSLADLLWRRQRTTEALDCLDRMLEQCPRHLEARLLRARIRHDVGDLAGAESDLEQLGSHGRAPVMRARFLAQQRRFREARACLATADRASDVERSALEGAIALGLGDVAAAVAHLQKSLAAEPTSEAALNLSTALEATGDLAGALNAACDAWRMAPGEPAAIARLHKLAGGALRARASDRSGDKLTIFFYQPAHTATDQRAVDAGRSTAVEPAVAVVAEALRARGHRSVVFDTADGSTTLDGVEQAPWETLPARCVSDCPDVVVGVQSCQLIGQARLAPLQILWVSDACDRALLDGLSHASVRAQIDFFLAASAAQATQFADRTGIPSWQILCDSGEPSISADPLASMAEALLEAGSAAEPAIIARIVVHLSAGRAGLAQRMLQAEALSPTMSADDAQLLAALVAWRAGGAPAPSADALRRIALRFPSIRRSGLLELATAKDAVLVRA